MRLREKSELVGVPSRRTWCRVKKYYCFVLPSVNLKDTTDKNYAISFLELRHNPTETISHVNFQRSQHLSFPLFRMPGAGPGLRSMVREIGEGAPASEGESSSGNQLNLEPVENSTQSQHAISKNSKSEFVEMLSSA